MNSLISKVREVEKTHIASEIESRLQEFKSFQDKNEEEWFSELCFCLLTANSKAHTAIAIQKQIGPKGFRILSQETLSECIKINKHRFHNNKSKYIVNARKHTNVKQTIQEIISSKGQLAAREWLVENVKGLGFKEASHFLRNVGYENLAIIDRHILSLMVENKLVEKPKNLGRENYLRIEKSLSKLADKLNMPHAKLDLYLWYIKTGEVLK